MNASDSAATSGTAAGPLPRAARRAYALSALLFAVYATSVLAGKAASLAGIALTWRLDDVGEFLVVVAMAVAFVTGLMLCESPPSAVAAGDDE